MLSINRDELQRVISVLKKAEGELQDSENSLKKAQEQQTIYINNQINQLEFTHIKKFSYNSHLLAMPSNIKNEKNRVKTLEDFIGIIIERFNCAERGIISSLDSIFYSYLNKIKGRSPIEETRVLTYKLHNQNIDPSNMTIDEFFACFGGDYYNGNRYGVNQGVFKEEYFYIYKGELNINSSFREIQELVMNRYHMSAPDAAVLIMALDSIGACSYATTAGIILYEYRDKPEEFAKNFGFPMYKETEDGKIVLNGEELMLDLYVFANSDRYKTHQIPGYESPIDSTIDTTYKYINPFNTNSVFGGLYREQYIDVDRLSDRNGPTFVGQQYLSYKQGISLITNDYYVSKTNENLTVGTICDEEKIETMDTIKGRLKYHLEKGDGIDMGFYPDATNSVYFEGDIDSENPDPYYLDGAHAVQVVDMDDKGVYFATWGYKAFISFEELEKANNNHGLRLNYIEFP